MKIYFARGSIRGATFEGKEAVYQAICAAIREKHTLLSEHAAVTGQAEQLDDNAIFLRDTGWIGSSDAMVAEVSAPSLGVGYEIAYALSKTTLPVLCLHQRDVRVSAMLTGNPLLLVLPYDTAKEAAALVSEFLSGRMLAFIAAKTLQEKSDFSPAGENRRLSAGERHILTLLAAAWRDDHETLQPGYSYSALVHQCREDNIGLPEARLARMISKRYIKIDINVVRMTFYGGQLIGQQELFYRFKEYLEYRETVNSPQSYEDWFLN